MIEERIKLAVEKAERDRAELFLSRYAEIMAEFKTAGEDASKKDKRRSFGETMKALGKALTPKSGKKN